LLKSAAQVQGLDEHQQRKLIFYLRQFLDAISPSNYAFTNPQVIHETVQTGGQNLAAGMEHLLRDMQPKNSLIKFLVDAGFTVFVISWKNPDASMEDIGFEDYLDLGPLDALATIREITGSRLVNAVGYCIGGTLLSMATMFNMLRANDLIWSNIINDYLLGKEPPAFDLLYWNADGTRMARAAHSFYLRNTYLENNLIKPGKIVLKGVPIDLGTIHQDIYAVGTQQDHIVPWQSAWRISQLASGKVRFVLGGSGHIAGIINPPGKGKGYWANDRNAASANKWLEGADHHDGSWWTDWLEWLKPRSGEQVSSPTMGSESQVGLVREDAKQDTASGDLGNAIGDRFGHGVDGVGSHCIAHIYDQMGDDIRAVGCLDQSYGQFSHASTQAGEHGILGVGELDDLCTRLQQPQACRTWVRDIDHLHLRLHDGISA
jgi:poly(3-hydroxyalkanoate) synthetase